MKKWNPQDYFGYGERSGMGKDPVVSDAMSTAVDQMRAEQQAKLEQERLLGESMDSVTPEEVAMIKKQMIEKLRGY